MPVDVIYVSAAETREILDLGEAVTLVERALRWQAEGQVVWSSPPLLNLQTTGPDSHFRIKGCYVRPIDAAGFRVTGFRVDPAGAGSAAPDNTRFVVVSEASTGRPRAIVDEHWTYNVRTVAAAGVAAKHLARTGSTRVGLVGAGQLAETGLLLLAAMFPIRSVLVTSRRAESREAFADRMRRAVRADVRAVGSPAEAVAGADIVLTCTSANARLVEAEWLAPGAFVCALGRNELADEVYRSADKTVMDSWDLSQESGDVRQMVSRGVLSRDRLHAELPDLVTGRRPGRESEGERIVARIEGLASQDVLIAHWVAERARERGVGRPVAGGL